MFRSFPRTRESRATTAGVRGPWVPAFAGTSGDEERFNLVGTCLAARAWIGGLLARAEELQRVVTQGAARGVAGVEHVAAAIDGEFEPVGRGERRKLID